MLGLPSNASTAEIKGAGTRALMRARLLADQDEESLRAIQDAIEALSDPVTRFRAGIEWPALGTKSAELLRTHPKLLDLRTNPSADRSDVTELLCEGESATGASHIRGVFLLLRASAMFTNRMMKVRPVPPEAAIQKLNQTAADLLIRGIAAWDTANSSEEFWMAQRMRAKELDDPRLGVGELREYRARAMEVSLGRFGFLAQEALKRRDGVTCRAITQALLVHTAQHPELSHVLTSVYGPLCGRVTTTVAALRSALSSTRAKTAEPFEKLLDRYTAEVSDDVELMLSVGDLPGTSEERARDAAADFLRELAVVAANNANAYAASKRALSYAEPAASSQTIRDRVRGDKQAVADLIKGSEHAAKAKPHFDRLTQALKQNNHRAALAALDALIPLEEGQGRAQLAQLRVQVSSGLATKLFNSALELVKAGCIDAALQELDEALVLETVPSERRTIESARAHVQSLTRSGGRILNAAKSGCLIPLVLGMSLVGASIAAVAVLTLHTDSILATLWSSISP